MRFIAADNGRVIEMLAEQSPIIEKAVKRLVYVSADENVRYQMAMREKAEMDYRFDMQDNYDMGRKEGALNKSIEVAKKLLSMGMSVEQAANATGLSVEDINRL